MKGTLYTSYFAKIKQGKGIKISVARFNPKWLNPTDIDEWFRDLAPSIDLLNNYKNGKINWNEYTKRYNEYITEGYFTNPIINKMICTIENTLDNGRDITIYCYEKPTDNCHRHLLGNVFRDMGYEVKEI